MVPLDEMAVFAHVVETGSFSAAARRLNSRKSSVSAQVQRLERALGVRLLNRTTRRLSTTEAGAAFYRHCARIVEEAEQAAGVAEAFHGQPRGLLRVAAPDTFGWMFVAPAVPQFLERYPDVSVELTLSESHVDLVQNRVDVAIRIGVVRQTSLVVRRLGISRLMVCAAPAYLDAQGTPKVPRDLGRHDCLVFSPLGWDNEWRFGSGARLTRIPVRARLVSDSGEVLRSAAIAGAGLALLPDWMVGEDLAAGRLVRVLPRQQLPSADIHAVFPPGRLDAPKVGLFVDHIGKYLRAALR